MLLFKKKDLHVPYSNEYSFFIFSWVSKQSGGLDIVGTVVAVIEWSVGHLIRHKIPSLMIQTSAGQYLWVDLQKTSKGKQKAL